MKEYKKPIIISEAVFEKIALLCDEYAYYDRENTPCYDDYLGAGKDDMFCINFFT